jgi:hypothetical protein
MKGGENKMRTYRQPEDISNNGQPYTNEDLKKLQGYLDKMNHRSEILNRAEEIATEMKRPVGGTIRKLYSMSEND